MICPNCGAEIVARVGPLDPPGAPQRYVISSTGITHEVESSDIGKGTIAAFCGGLLARRSRFVTEIGDLACRRCFGHRRQRQVDEDGKADAERRLIAMAQREGVLAT